MRGSSGINNFFFSAALCGVVVYNYLKMKDARTSQLSSGVIPDKAMQVNPLKLLLVPS